MLVLSRRNAESISISLADESDPAMTVAELFADGPIEVTVLGSTASRVKLGVSAPRTLAIWRRDADESIVD
ncbi:MAG: carbon storage regulator [Pseudomonadota bacterium]